MSAIRLRRSAQALTSPLRISGRELVVVMAVAVALLLAVSTVPVGSHALLARLAGVVCALTEAGSLLWMRRAPARAMAVAIGAGAGLQALFGFVGAWGGATLALYVFARVRPARVSLVALGAMLALAPWNRLIGGWWSAAVAAAAAVVAWCLGALARARTTAREQQLREAVAAERRRIARELHDVIAHNVSVMVVQATAAEDAFGSRPEQARDALTAIASAGRGAMHDLRRMLAVVRTEDEDSARTPPAGLDDLDRLAASVGGAGLRVAVDVEGVRRRIPPGVDMSAYRIVQEALTNTLRHAAASQATVLVRYLPERIELQVTDDGGGGVNSSRVQAGRGIIGMRERAALLGGVVEAGLDPRGGFRVFVRLPLEDAP